MIRDNSNQFNLDKPNNIKVESRKLLRKGDSSLGAKTFGKYDVEIAFSEKKTKL